MSAQPQTKQTLPVETKLLFSVRAARVRARYSPATIKLFTREISSEKEVRRYTVETDSGRKYLATFELVAGERFGRCNCLGFSRGKRGGEQVICCDHLPQAADFDDQLFPRCLS